MQVVDYTYFIMIDQMVALSQIGAMKKPDLTLFMNDRISWKIWLCILITYMTILVLLYYFKKFLITKKIYVHNHNHWKNKNRDIDISNLSNFGFVAINLYQINLRQCNKMNIYIFND